VTGMASTILEVIAPDPLTDEVIAEMTKEIEADCSDETDRTFRITHRYDLGNQDVYVMRRTGDVNPLRAALYCQFKCEEWLEHESFEMTNLGIAAMLVMHYGFRQAPATDACTTIDMHSDREKACGQPYYELMADPSLHREGLREAMTHFFA
jgi:hypothetical protein